MCLTCGWHHRDHPNLIPSKFPQSELGKTNQRALSSTTRFNSNSFQSTEGIAQRLVVSRACVGRLEFDKMAKWGEGDPRWLVENRQDGKNVNAWHWEEINRMEWSRRRMSELFSDLTLKCGSAKIVQVKELSGEAAVCTRKGGKRFATFDLALTLAWEGQVEGNKANGTIKVTEFACTNDVDEYRIEVTAEGSGEPQNTLQQRWKESADLLLQKLKIFSEEICDTS